MAHFLRKLHSLLSLIVFFFLFLFLAPPFASRVASLSTLSISETSNQTLVCALIKPPGRRPFLNCTSFPAGIRIPVNPNASFAGVVGGDGFLCGLRGGSLSPTSVLGCWRFSAANGTNVRYKRIYKGPPVTELDSGDAHVCSLANGTSRLECWQWPGWDRTRVPDDWSSVAVGGDYACGLMGTGKIACFGDNARVVHNWPNGSFRAVAAGSGYACAISWDNTNSLECWGDGAAKIEPPQGDFVSVALGENRSCALGSNSRVKCWGQSNFSLPEHLTDAYFVAIKAKRRVFCGVLASNYSLCCWGNEHFDSMPGSMVFDNVLPGPCQSQCPCGPLPGYGILCEQGYVCLPCKASAPVVHPPSPGPAPPPVRSRGLDGKLVVFLVVGCVGSASLLSLFGFLLFRYCKGRVCRVHDSGRIEETSSPDQTRPPPPQPRPLEKRLSHLVSMDSHLEEFPLQVLARVTNGFAQEFKIGTGSFGSVYRATLDDGREVAIKRAETSTAASPLHLGGGGGPSARRQTEDIDRAFLNELESLSRLNHKNLVKLCGFCEDGNELILVYEYMHNGSLHDHLHRIPESPLDSWAARLRVALDAARGIEYLHVYATPPVIHRDIKSSNILLNKSWTAKVSDFGLSLMCPEDDNSHLSLHAAGTIGYVDPEYYRLQHLTSKSDVYSFGVVLLELLSGYKAIHNNETGVPRNVVDFVIPYILQDEIHRVLDRKVLPPNPFEIEAVRYAGYLAADCVSLEGKDRPSITEIVYSLERALAACSARPLLSRSSTESSTS
ncbi:serine/threonine-protein kinase-like protein CCR4 [Rhodamnia argentea]|uniref:Serine/threonine-protein kinase-like protein CCR4 n=1 Tax=Rhodamnia argentea TaxID=178133 RepID=A0A8B8MSH2_9MYRT|nr:serine/threonine-protein kinase-like protein CCR4 [Rhodamnia argentea]